MRTAIRYLVFGEAFTMEMGAGNPMESGARERLRTGNDDIARPTFNPYTRTRRNAFP